MSLIGSERARTVPLNSTVRAPGEPENRPTKPIRSGIGPIIFALALGAFWIGTASAWLWGYFGPALFHVAVPFLVPIGFSVLMPPLLVLAGAWTFVRGQTMTLAAEGLVEASARLVAVDENSAHAAARLGRAVRRELDALNSGLDSASARLRALESVLEKQISALDEAGARADVRAEAAASRLANERERLDALAGTLSDTAAKASELVAGRSAQLKANMESAENALKAAGVTLDTHVSAFRSAAEAAAEAPHTVAVEIERQSKRIEEVSDAAIGRAEFVLGRHERHRTAMLELLQKLKDDGTTFDTALNGQRTSLEKAVASVGEQAQNFESLLIDADRKLELMMANGATRTAQLAASMKQEVQRVADFSEKAGAALAKVVEDLGNAGSNAHTLMEQTASDTKAKAGALVGDAMAECEKLLRVAGELAAKGQEIKAALASVVEEMQGHLLLLPGVAKQEAQRVREVVRQETDEMLDLSARTLSTVQSRSVPRPAPKLETQSEIPGPEPESDGLLGLARRLTQRAKRKDDAKSSWEMSTLLAAADEPRDFKPEAAAALGALQAVLADLAIDLEAIAPGAEAGADEWRRYLAGDRSVFARRLAQMIDETAVDRIASLYRDNLRFRESANVYIAEFETLLSRAREGDGNGLLASTILSADTGKIYLTLAYALGRLS
ncbi:MAG TPA: hypothetical protein VN154_07910 [Rhizomicrobium sp.]|nr:hypothetical protein [Rhizomicrobium sp.]